MNPQCIFFSFVLTARDTSADLIHVAFIATIVVFGAEMEPLSHPATKRRTERDRKVKATLAHNQKKTRKGMVEE